MAKDKKPNDDEPENSSENYSESDDTFGLPEIEYEPIKRDEPLEDVPQADAPEEPVYRGEEPREEETVFESEPVGSETYEEQEPVYERREPSEYTYTYSHETDKPVWPRALAIVLAIVLVVGGALWYFLYYAPMKEEERRIAAAQLAATDAAYKKEKARQDSLAQVENLRAQRVADSLASIPKTPPAGTIDTLTGRTGLYYVVVASDIDDDLLLDYAKRLSSKGVSSTIIPPHGKVKFFRLAVANGENWANAQSAADQLKSDFGSGVWVTKY